jgi:DnaJ domain
MRNDSSDWRSAWITLMGTSPPGDLRDVDPAVIKVAFRQRARQTHPDLAGAKAQDGRAFREVAEAYDRLLQGSENAGRCGQGRRRRESVADGPVRVIQRGQPAERPPGIPNRRLALAQFLFHIGWVSWDAVLESLRWQQANRSPLGRLAVELGGLRDGDVRRILRHQRAGERFGACAARLGLLPPNALARLLERQRRLQPLVGQFFVQRGLLSPQRLAEALKRQRAHNDEVERGRDSRAA